MESNNMTTTNNSIIDGRHRAVFLTAIMLMTPLLMSVALAGPAAAASNGVQVTYEEDAVYQGEVLSASNSSDIVEGNTYSVYKVDNTYDENDTVTEYSEVDTVTGQSDGNVFMHTTEYTTGEQFFVATESTNPDNAEIDAEDDTFTVEDNSFEVNIETPVKNTGSDTTSQLELDSPQDMYDVIVTSDSLDNSQLTRILSGENDIDLSEKDSVSESQYSDPSVSNRDVAQHVTSSDLTEHVTFDENTKKYVVESGFFTSTTDNIADGTSFEDIGITTIDEYKSEVGYGVVVTDAGDVVAKNVDGGSEDVDFNGISAGSYTVNYEVTDSQLTDSTSVIVEDVSVSGSFSESTYTAQSGSVVEATVQMENTETAYVQIGSTEAQFIDVVKLSGSDEITFKINTRLLGTNAATDEVYTVVDDGSVVDSGVHGSLGADASSSELFVDEDGDAIDSSADSAFQAYLADLGLLTSGTQPPEAQLIRPVQPAEYDLIAGANLGNGVFEVTGDTNTQAVEEIANSKVNLVKPSVDGVSTYIAPPGTANSVTEMSELEDKRTERSEIPLGDKLVVEFEASGIDGVMSAQVSDTFDVTNPSGDDDSEKETIAKPLDQVSSINGEGVEISIEELEGTGNQEAPQFELSNEQIEEMMLIPNDESMVLVIDTSSDNVLTESELEPGTDYTATVTYDTSSDGAYEFVTDSNDAVQGPFEGGADGDTSVDAYPYFSAGETGEASAEFTIEERTATFNEKNTDGVVEVTASDGVTVTGETNVAPGSTIEVIAEKLDGDTFTKTQEVEVSDNGEFSAEFDFASKDPGVEFQVSTVSDSDTYQTTDATVVEELEDIEEDDEQQEEDSEEEDDSSEEEGDTSEEEDDGSTDDSSDDDSSDSDELGSGSDDGETVTDDSTPGFGLGVAIASLLAAGLVVLRKKD